MPLLQGLLLNQALICPNFSFRQPKEQVSLSGKKRAGQGVQPALGNLKVRAPTHSSIGAVTSTTRGMFVQGAFGPFCATSPPRPFACDSRRSNEQLLEKLEFLPFT